MAEDWHLPRIGSVQDPLRLGVLISGSGSGMEALLRHQMKDECRHTTTVVVSDKSDVAGLSKAQDMGVTAIVVPLPDISDSQQRRLAHEDEVNQVLADHGVEVIVLSGYMRILTPSFVKPWAGRLLNIHPSLLPKYRGPSPVVTAILEGENTVGVTIMLLDEGMDTGPILAQSTPMRLSGTERGAELQRALFKEGASMLPNVLNGLQEGTLTAEPQDDSKASVTKLINKSDAQIDWASPAEYIERMIRAYDSWPGTFTSWNGKVLKVLDAQISSASASVPAVGAGVVVVDEGRVNVGTGSASIELKKVQLEGRQAIAAADFVISLILPIYSAL